MIDILCEIFFRITINELWEIDVSIAAVTTRIIDFILVSVVKMHDADPELTLLSSFTNVELMRLNVVKATIEAMSITLETLAAVQLLSAPSTQNTVVPTPVTISLCKMKHLELPTFSWELREWRSFSEQFQFTVGNADFPDI